MCMGQGGGIMPAIIIKMNCIQLLLNIQQIKNQRLKVADSYTYVIHKHKDQ